MERLVEVAEAEEQEVVRIAPLPLVVLAHHRRQRGEVDVGSGSRPAATVAPRRLDRAGRAGSA